MNNFNSNNEDNETVRQTLTRVAKQYGWFDNPVTMNINGNDVTYYVDQNSPFAKPKQALSTEENLAGSFTDAIPQHPNMPQTNSNNNAYYIRDDKNYAWNMPKQTQTEVLSRSQPSDWDGVAGAAFSGFADGVFGGTERFVNGLTFGAYGYGVDQFLDNAYSNRQNRLHNNANQNGLGYINSLSNRLIDGSSIPMRYLLKK